MRESSPSNHQEEAREKKKTIRISGGKEVRRNQPGTVAVKMTEEQVPNEVEPLGDQEKEKSTA